MRRLAVVILVLLSACSKRAHEAADPAKATNHTKPIAPADSAFTGKEYAAAAEGFRSALDETLKDCPSARFRSVLISSSEKQGSRHYLVCGLVNSKNSLGGYVGWTPFTIIGGTAEIVTDKLSAMYVSMVCKQPFGPWQVGHDEDLRAR